MNRRQWRIVTRPHYRLFTSGISTGDEEMLARRYGYTGVHRRRCASGAWNKEEGGKSSHMPENVNHVQVHEVLAYNTFNVITLVQETMQKIVSDNLLACYIIYGKACGEKYRVTYYELVCRLSQGHCHWFFG